MSCRRLDSFLLWVKGSWVRQGVLRRYRKNWRRMHMLSQHNIEFGHVLHELPFIHIRSEFLKVSLWVLEHDLETGRVGSEE